MPQAHSCVLTAALSLSVSDPDDALLERSGINMKITNAAASVLSCAVFALSLSLGVESAHAVVVCKTVGVPKGCVARAPVAVAPVARVARPAARPAVRAGAAVARPGVPGNRGGPVNRVGRF